MKNKIRFRFGDTLMFSYNNTIKVWLTLDNELDLFYQNNLIRTSKNEK